MTDRYLFRAKRIDNGEWVTGYYGMGRREWHNGNKLSPCIDYEEKGAMCFSLIDPETLGQCTGLRDDNGTMIFEGDRLLLTQTDEKPHYATVAWGTPNGLNSWGWQLMFDEPLGLNPDILLWVETESLTMWCEIVGNIHDDEVKNG